jgi:O-antigen ligase
LPAATILVLYTAKKEISWRLILIASVLYAVALLLFGSAASEGGVSRTLLDQNPIWAARAVMVGALVAVLGPFRLVVKLVTAPVLVLAGVLTLSLGPSMGMVLGLLAAAVTALIQSGRRTGRPSPGWVLLVIATGFGLIALLSGVLDWFIGPLIDDPNVTARSGYIDASISLFLRSPLFGDGIGGFASTGLDQYPHNLVLEIAVEMGIIGLAGLVAWGILALAGAARSPLLMGLVVGTGAFTLFSGSLAGQNEFWMLSAVAVALAPTAIAARRGVRRRAPSGQAAGTARQTST